MEVLHTKERMQQTILRYRETKTTIGFVPTMGALHEGHLSLVGCSRRRDDVTVVSIFVNPTQFNQRDDYDKYPRDLKGDLHDLEQAGVDVVFTPTEQEMYPEADNRKFDFGGLDQVMEGRHRPGHFDGVARIVTKLFDVVMPHRAYFGEKDFQQLAIIRHLNRQMNYQIDVVGCPIVRESDGLAKSSRNARLSPGQHKEAASISQALFEASDHAGRFTPDQIREQVISRLNKNPQIDVEYFDIVDEKTLMPIQQWDEAGDKRACIAAWVGEVRLIDNVKISF